MSSTLVARALYLALGLVSAAVGAWAAVAPRSFFDSFPGGGRHWLPPLGPYNEHLIRDFGSLNLGFAIAALIAAAYLTRPLALAVTAAYVVYGVPHFVFHATETRVYGTGDNVANLIALALDVVVPILAAALLWRRQPR